MIRKNVKRNDLYIPLGVLLAVCFLTLPLLQGCTAATGSVIAATGTTIGLELSQNQTTQTPMGVLGYKRAELAYVPTNRGVTDKKTISTDPDGTVTETHDGALQPMEGGAKDSANVLMELRYSGIFDWGSGSGIYQRLAVGDKAVAQPGASMMFAKNTAGNIEPAAAAALSTAEANLFSQISPADWQKALTAAKERAGERRPKIDIIVNRVRSAADKSLVDPEKLKSLVGKAGLDAAKDPIKQLLSLKKADDVWQFLDISGEELVDKLLQAAVAS